MCVNEHHQNAYGNMPSPNLIASILARQTTRVKIAVVGNALPLYDPPTRVAEEFAMIDVISGGRLIAGMVVGGGPEYYSFSVNPAHARERFQEAHDLIVKAWTTPGPFEWVSKHFRIRYVNPWPRPVQQPHPEIWIPGAGSLETMEFVARNHYAYMGIPYFHLDVFERYFSMFRDACEAEGYTADPLQAGWLVPIYVAETDEQARAEYEEHLWYFVKRLLPGITIQPPGYTSVRSLGNILKGAGTFMLNVDTLGRDRRRPLRDRRLARDGHRAARSTASAGSASATCSGSSSSAACPPTSPRQNLRAASPRRCMPRLRAEFPEGAPVLPAVGEGRLMADVHRGVRRHAVGEIQLFRGGERAAARVPALRRRRDTHPALEQLAESFEVIVPIFPGFGESEGVEEIDGMEDVVFHLLDLWDAPRARRAARSLGHVARRVDGARARDAVPGAGRRSSCSSTRSGSTSTTRRSRRCSAARRASSPRCSSPTRAIPSRRSMHADGGVHRRRRASRPRSRSRSCSRCGRRSARRRASAGTRTCTTRSSAAGSAA